MNISHWNVLSDELRNTKSRRVPSSKYAKAENMKKMLLRCIKKKRLQDIVGGIIGVFVSRLSK